MTLISALSRKQVDPYIAGKSAEMIGYWLCTNKLQCKDLPIVLKEFEVPYIPHEKQTSSEKLETVILLLSRSWTNLTWGRESQWPDHPEHRLSEVRMIWAHIPTFLSAYWQEELFRKLSYSRKSAYGSSNLSRFD